VRVVELVKFTKRFFFRSVFPLYVSIFYSIALRKRIFTAIGAILLLVVNKRSNQEAFILFWLARCAENPSKNAYRLISEHGVLKALKDEKRKVRHKPDSIFYKK